MGSDGEALAHGFRAVKRLRSKIASDQMSFARGEYGGDEEFPFWHSDIDTSGEISLISDIVPTWAHVVNTSSAPFLAASLCRREPEVSKADGFTTIPAKNILRFEVPVKYSQRMTMRYCGSQLGENTSHKTSATEVYLLMQNQSEQVAARREVHDEESIGGGKRETAIGRWQSRFDDTMKTNDAWVGACTRQTVKSNLAHVEATLPLLLLRVAGVRGAEEALHCVKRAGRSACAVNDAITAVAEHGVKLECT